MRRAAVVLLLGALAVLVTAAISGPPLAKDAPDPQYEVLSPWAEVDPVRGILQRLDTVAGMKIGLFANFDRAASQLGQACGQVQEHRPQLRELLGPSAADGAI